jgi:hypothetical protein
VAAFYAAPRRHEALGDPACPSLNCRSPERE